MTDVTQTEFSIFLSETLHSQDPDPTMVILKSPVMSQKFRLQDVPLLCRLDTEKITGTSQMQEYFELISYDVSDDESQQPTCAVCDCKMSNGVYQVVNHNDEWAFRCHASCLRQIQTQIQELMEDHPEYVVSNLI